MKITDFINNKEHKVTIFDKYIYIYNYTNIINFSSDRINISLDNKNYVFIGNKLVIKKLTKEELLISGEVSEIKIG